MRTPAIFALEWKRQGCELAATSSRVRERVWDDRKDLCSSLTDLEAR